MLVVTGGVRLVACRTLFGDVIFLRFGVLLVFLVLLCVVWCLR